MARPVDHPPLGSSAFDLGTGQAIAVQSGPQQACADREAVTSGYQRNASLLTHLKPMEQ